jgi:SAM-dependent methyltransferase
MNPVARLKTPHGDIVVLRDRSSVAYWQDDRHQSHADKSGISRAAYIHAIHGLLLQVSARDVLMIGCGGGTLATMLRMSGVNVTIAEINQSSFEISRKYFELPDDVECHVADGRTFLQETTRRFDGIVLDAYDGDDIPGQLRSTAFFDLVRSRLNDGGCFFANVILRNGRDRRLADLVQTMNASWPAVRVLDPNGARTRNAIAMAGAVVDLQRPTLTLKPKTGAKTLTRELEAMSFQPGAGEQKRSRVRTKKSRWFEPVQPNAPRTPTGRSDGSISTPGLRTPAGSSDFFAAASAWRNSGGD